MATEIYKRYRPKALRDLVGQEGAIRSLEKLVDSNSIPHALLFTGPSGVGKTTLARILKTHLRCADSDFVEKNCADFRSIDDVRDIRRSVGFQPMGGPSKIYLIDECHKLTNDAQNALLKMLEDTPAHAYFMLATTDPQKLIKTIHTRCSQVKLNPIKSDALTTLVGKVAKKEGFSISEEVMEELIVASEGSARKALVILEQVGKLDTESEQLEGIQATTLAKDAAIDLARALLNPRADWTEVAQVLGRLTDTEPEGVRYCVLGYMRSVMLKGGKLAPRAYMIIDLFSRNFYDSKQAGLAAACWETIYHE